MSGTILGGGAETTPAAGTGTGTDPAGGAGTGGGAGGGGGTETPPSTGASWRDALPDDLKSDATLVRFKTQEEAIRSGLEARKMIGSSVQIPKADAPEKDWNDFMAKLRPEKAEEYKFTKPAGSETAWDDALENGFRATAHRLGLPLQTAAGLFAWYNEFQQGRATAVEQEMEKGLNALRAEWGDAFKGRAAGAFAAVKRLGGQAAVDLMESSGLGNHPVMVRIFDAVREAIEEDHPPKGERGGTVGADAAKAKIAAIRADPKHAYNNSKASAEERSAASREMLELYKVLYPEEE